MPTQQDILNWSQTANLHVQSAQPGLAPVVQPLIGWAAFHVASARVGQGILASLASPQGWTDLQSLLCVDAYDVTEAGALGLTAAAVSTSINLAAAAALRLAGAKPSNRNYEFDAADHSGKAAAAVTLSPALAGWWNGVGACGCPSTTSSLAVAATSWSTRRLHDTSR